MFFVVSKLAWFVLQPLVAVVLLFGVGLAAGRLRWRRLARVLFVAAAGLLLICALSPAGLLMTHALEQRFPPAALPETVAGIVVLGGSFDTRVARSRGTAELNEAADRVTAAVELARRFPAARVLFSGGVAAVFEADVPEVQSAREMFEALGLAPDRLLLEGRARNTAENASFSKTLADPQPGETWLLVTSAYHMPRAVGCFRVAGFDILPYPVDYRTPLGEAVWRPSSATTRNLEKFHFALREYLGLLAYWMTGRTDALFPAPTAAMPEAPRHPS